MPVRIFAPGSALSGGVALSLGFSGALAVSGVVPMGASLALRTGFVPENSAPSFVVGRIRLVAGQAYPGMALAAIASASLPVSIGTSATPLAFSPVLSDLINQPGWDTGLWDDATCWDGLDATDSTFGLVIGWTSPLGLIVHMGGGVAMSLALSEQAQLLLNAGCVTNPTVQQVSGVALAASLVTSVAVDAESC